MIPIVFINCSVLPFIAWIISGRKTFETRTRNTLRSLVGQRVYIAETGRRGGQVVRCSATIRSVVVVRSRKEWIALRSAHRVPGKSQYDWKPWTKVKYMYELSDVVAMDPFTPPEGVRHGRVWMEYILN